MPINGDKHRFTRKNVDLVPDSAGVYALYENGEVAYYGAAVGRGETIKSRLGEHLTGRHTPGRTSTKDFSYEVTRYPLSRERALLEEHRRDKRQFPPYNGG
jgi:excinuclease UvrABC nuclease subunit